MLNGIDPIIIFQFSKLAPTLGKQLEKIPVISKIPTLIDQPPIPIYLSQAKSGIQIDSEDKNVDIETNVETLSDASPPDVTQKGISSIVRVTLTSKKNSVGMTLLSALIDTLFEKVSAKEYSITYLHGATTIFRGVLHSYAVNQNSNDDKLSVTIEISKGTNAPQKPAGTAAVPGVELPLPGPP